MSEVRDLLLRLLKLSLRLSLGRRWLHCVGVPQKKRSLRISFLGFAHFELTQDALARLWVLWSLRLWRHLRWEGLLLRQGFLDEATVSIYSLLGRSWSCRHKDRGVHPALNLLLMLLRWWRGVYELLKLHLRKVWLGELRLMLSLQGLLRLDWGCKLGWRLLGVLATSVSVVVH